MHGVEFRFCPRCAAPLEIQVHFGAERPACPACGWMYFADPKVAVAVVVLKEGKILLTRRINEPEQGKWTLPAGFVDAFEDPCRAAERECIEETGLQVCVEDFLCLLSGREHPRGSDIFIVYRARLAGGSLHAGDDADQAAFFPLDSLPPLAFQSTRQVIGMIS